METNTSLMKLLASKDVAAFHALEATAHSMPSMEMPYSPMDDESIARNLMERYSKQGIDPNLALAPDTDPLEEFGGKDAFL
jgi:hypothetical protein